MDANDDTEVLIHHGSLDPSCTGRAATKKYSIIILIKLSISGGQIEKENQATKVHRGQTYLRGKC